jgi:hypothetical protein
MKLFLINRYVITSLLYLLTAIFLVACADIPANDDKLNKLLTQYSQLRTRQKVLPQGVFDKELRSPDGQLSNVLGELGTQLGNPAYKKADIIRLMGEPDAIKSGKDYQPHSIGQRSEKPLADDLLLIYFWRGWHDYLYFVSRNDIIQDARWYFAGE